MTITECIEQRRSIRKYTEQEVEREKIEEVLRAALLAPSGKNRQPWKYLVYQSEEKEKLLDEMEKGLNREKHEEALLPESRRGLPSAFHTLRDHDRSRGGSGGGVPDQQDQLPGHR